jgi:hypothetical protein
MRKAYLIGEPETKLTVTESNMPDVVILESFGIRVELTKAEFNSLCGLRYSIAYADYPDARTTLINPTNEPGTDDIPF